MINLENSSSSQVQINNAKALVKWYNTIKGFGFVTMLDGAGDAFIHVSTIEAAGYQSLSEGDQVEVELVQGPRGLQVSKLLTMIPGTAASLQRVAMVSSISGPVAYHGSSVRDSSYSPPLPFSHEQPRSAPVFGREPSSSPYPTPASMGRLLGVVKWFDTVKGFGFIIPENGGNDIFIHVSALERSNVRELFEGAQVLIELRQGKKGPEVDKVMIL